MKHIVQKFKDYLPLIKGKQTLLLMLTGTAGYLTSRCPYTSFPIIFLLILVLFLSIGGSTILNMWFDRDIDSKMTRTMNRSLVSGKVKPTESLLIGLVMSCLGVAIAFVMEPIFGAIIFAGVFFDVLVYTVWLKRRSAWSIIWGGISGAMPILAGRALGLTSLGLPGIDWIGMLLGLGILLWIPTHILTFNMKYFNDYQAAGIPTIAASYGINFNRKVIAASSILASIAMTVAAWGIGVEWGFLRLLGVLSIGMIILAVAAMTRPNETVNFGLFKYASLYMFSSMVLMAF